MKLSRVARAFDTTPCYDAYSGTLLFRAQLGLYDDNKRDSETAERRVLSVGPSITVPARRVVAAAGSRWIMGHPNPDTFRSDVIRVGFSVHEAPELARIRSIAQVVADQQGVTAYAGRVWVKNNAFTEQSSHLAPQHHIHFSTTEAVADDSLVTYAGRNYVVRASNFGAGGTLVTTCDELPEPSVEVGTITGSGYNVITDSVGTSSNSVRVLRLRWQSLFRYRNSNGPTFGPEDMQVALPKTVTVVTGAKLVLSDGTWFIASVSDEAGVWLCRATRNV